MSSLPPDFPVEPPAPTGSGDPDAAVAMARQVQAVTLRLSGLSYEAIAERMGYSDRSTAHHTVMRALEATRNERAAELRDLENARLDRAQAAIWPGVLAGAPRVVDTLIRLSARRCRMNGLDAPIQVAVSQSIRADLADALVMLRESVTGETLAVHDEPYTA